MKKIHLGLCLLLLTFSVSHSFAADSIVKIEVISDEAVLKYNILQIAIDHVEDSDGFKMLEASETADLMIKMAVASIKDTDIHGTVILVASSIAMVVLKRNSNGSKSILKFHNEVINLNDIDTKIKERMTEILED